MTTFIRLLAEKDKAQSLWHACQNVRGGISDRRAIDLDPRAFLALPGSPFAYWVSSAVRTAFTKFPRFEGNGRTAKVGLATADDFRFVRLWWEINPGNTRFRHHTFAKGGNYSAFHTDFHLVLRWGDDGAELKETVIAQHGNAGKRVYNEDYYFKPAITWPLRAHRLSPQALPRNSIFSVRGYTAHTPEGDELPTLAIFSSSAFDYLFKTALGRFGYPEFIVGVLQNVPWPAVPAQEANELAQLALSAWKLKRSLSTTDELSHAFELPSALQGKASRPAPHSIRNELQCIQEQIDEIVFDLFNFTDVDRMEVKSHGSSQSVDGGDGETEAEEAEESEEPIEASDQSTDLLSWAVGVSFGRFDWRLATKERAEPLVPEPFDALPATSPGMLPEGSEPFHRHQGILVDDPGHRHDLARLVEDVLGQVGVTPNVDVRNWLQSQFFDVHVRRYSRSRRKAPIYLPLATSSGSYTVWLYYPRVDHQTLYTVVNDFVEPKLKQVEGDLAPLRVKGKNRSREDERRYEALQFLEQELIELRDQVLKLAPSYKPSYDDGVQVAAAPLWPLFRNKSWQKFLKETWTKLEKGEYDWAQLAMNYWPDRVGERCKTDKSLAIAHGLEHLYQAPPTKAAAKRGRKAKEQP